MPSYVEHEKNFYNLRAGSTKYSPLCFALDLYLMTNANAGIQDKTFASNLHFWYTKSL